jgi:2-oxoglutarate dehydrogenase E2 component (dihydrolipoamide succinyltransferase)
MPVELKVPPVGESITEVQIGDWLKKVGDAVERDQPVVSIESDKATVEVPAPISGVVTEMRKKKGDTATVGEVIGMMEEGGGGASSGSSPAAASAPAPAAAPAKADSRKSTSGIKTEQPKKAEAPAPVPTPAKPETVVISPAKYEPPVAPVMASLEPGREQEVVPMTPIRRRIAERLVEAQHSAALLTTFNEIDMSTVMSLRGEQKEAFSERYGVKLGFMSFFIKAAVDALKLVPQVNASIRNNEIVYHNYYDIGVAVGGGKGLVVPVIRNAERLSFADVEKTIEEYGKRAKENKIKLEELQGGTFTISNGGVYGSLLSTPIVNPPQSGILGLHAIQDRPMAVKGQVVIKPMMYVALTYDHRIIDGREAVTFLKRIKECIENPARMLLEI